MAQGSQYVGETNAGERDNISRFAPMVLILAYEGCNLEILLENEPKYEDVQHQFDLLDGNARCL